MEDVLLRPLRLAISGSCFIFAMPDELRKAAYVLPVGDRPAKFDDRLNNMMAEFTREMMQAVDSIEDAAMECYHSTVWDRDRMVGIVLEHPGIEYWSVHSPYGRYIDPSSPLEIAREGAVEAYCDTISVAERLGSKVIVAHPGANVKYDVDKREQIELAVEPFRRIADFAGERGIEVAIEPLPKEEVGCRLEEVLEIVEKIDRPNVGVNFNVNHLFPPEKIPAMIRQAGSCIRSVHISDQDGIERHWLPFEGTMDWAEVLRALVEVDYTGPLVYEAHIHDVETCEEVGANGGRELRAADPTRAAADGQCLTHLTTTPRLARRCWRRRRRCSLARIRTTSSSAPPGLST